MLVFDNIDIYRQYEPNEYFKKFIKELEQRPDCRKVSEHRSMRIGVNPSNNSVTVSRGNCIVVASLETSISEVVFSPLTNSYGNRLLSISPFM